MGGAGQTPQQGGETQRGEAPSCRNTNTQHHVSCGQASRGRQSATFSLSDNTRENMKTHLKAPFELLKLKTVLHSFLKCRTSCLGDRSEVRGHTLTSVMWLHVVAEPPVDAVNP